MVEGILASFFVRLPSNVEKAVYTRLRKLEEADNFNHTETHLDGICPLVSHLERLIRVGDVVIQRLTDLLMDMAVGFRGAKLVVRSSLADGHDLLHGSLLDPNSSHRLGLAISV